VFLCEGAVSSSTASADGFRAPPSAVDVQMCGTGGRRLRFGADCLTLSTSSSFSIFLPFGPFLMVFSNGFLSRFLRIWASGEGFWLCCPSLVSSREARSGNKPRLVRILVHQGVENDHGGGESEPSGKQVHWSFSLIRGENPCCLPFVDEQSASLNWPLANGTVFNVRRWLHLVPERVKGPLRKTWAHDGELAHWETSSDRGAG